MSKTFYQYDKKWAYKKYPSWGTGNYRNCGCCPTALADILVNFIPTITPKSVGDYISKINGATKGGATYHDAPQKVFNHFCGDKADCTQLNTASVYKKKNTKAEQTFKKRLKAGGWGILLFGKSKFTAGGHYIACTAVKTENNVDYYYLRDSGLRKNVGWFKWKEIQGNVKVFYAITAKEAPKPTDKKGYDGTFPSITKTVSTNRASLIVDGAKKLAWAYGTSEKKWSYSTGNPTTACRTAIKKYMKKSARISLSDCGYFVSTVVRMVGIDSSFNCLKWQHPSTFKVVHKGKKIPSGTLKAGDIVRYKKTNGAQHTLIYVGNGRIAEAGRKTRFGVIRSSKKYNDANVKHSTLEVMRVVEHKTTVNSYLSKGDKGANIRNLQKFLNWYGDYGLKIDGIYGDNTVEAQKKFQTSVGLKADGCFGEASLAKAKEIKK